MNTTNKIKHLLRYPIKSLEGEYMEKVHIDENGVAGDRQYALKESATGLIVSAKNPRKWEKIIQLSAHLEAGKLMVKNRELDLVLTNKTAIEAHIHQITSQKVELLSTNDIQTRQLRAADRSPIDQLGTVINEEPLALASKEQHFFDFAPLHIITTSSLQALQNHYPEGNFAIERFRPNLVIDTGESAGFVENGWLGKTIQIGSQLQIKIIEACPRCVLTSLAQNNGIEKDIQILKTIVQHNTVNSHTFAPGTPLKGVLGVYAVVECAGEVNVEDEVEFV